jgi:hypothetical protein
MMYFAVHLINLISETVILSYYWFQRRAFTPTCTDVPVSILEFILIEMLNFINVSSIFRDKITRHFVTLPAQVYRIPTRRHSFVIQSLGRYPLASKTSHFIIVRDLVHIINEFVDSAVGNVCRLPVGLCMP